MDTAPPPSDDAPPTGDSATLGAADRASTVGLLVIHGMGVEREGDTIADIGDPFLAWSANWLTSRGGHAVTSPASCSCDDGGNAAPRHYHALWTLREGHNIDLTISEGWWASEFAGPSASRESSWIPSLVWNVAWRGLLWLGLIVAALMSAVWVLASGKEEDITPSLAIAFAVAGLLVLFAFLLPAALLLLGKLPFLKDLSTAVLKFLVLSVGDVMVYEKSTTQTANAVEKIRRDLAWLETRSDHVVVAAHSLGSLLAVDLLTATPSSKVTTLVTFGSAIKILKRRPRKYVHALSEKCPDITWVNVYDPFDFISGPIDHRRNFPVNLRIDNCRSVLTAHSAYPQNTDQFLTVLHRLVRLAANGEGTTGDKPAAAAVAHESQREIRAAIRRRNHRWWQGLMLLPAAMTVATSVALLLLKNHYAEFLHAIGEQLPLPGPIRQTLAAAALRQPQAEAWVCFLSGLLIAAAYAWGVRLALLRSEARSDDQLALQGYLKWSPWLERTIDLLLVAPAALTLLAFAWGSPSAENLWRELRFAAIPLLATAVLGVWAWLARGARRMSARVPANGFAAKEDPLAGGFDAIKWRPRHEKTTPQRTWKPRVKAG